MIKLIIVKIQKKIQNILSYGKVLAIQIERSLWGFFHQIVCVYQAQKTNGEIQE